MHYDGPKRDPYLRFELLEQKVGICHHFADTFCELAKLVGLECVTYSPSYDHEACLVKISGQWFTQDPTAGGREVAFMNPVDYEAEYNRGNEEFWQGDSGQRMQKLIELNKKLENGEISEEEFNKEASAIWN